jgi:hypothetical protein
MLKVVGFSESMVTFDRVRDEFYPEDGGSSFVRIVGNFWRDYTANSTLTTEAPCFSETLVILYQCSWRILHLRRRQQITSKIAGNFLPEYKVNYTLKMEAENSSETLLTTYQTTLRIIPDDSNLHSLV